MQRELVTEKHDKWIEEVLGVTFDDVEGMTEEELDNLVDKLADMEADAVTSKSEDVDVICEVVDIICGPYDEEEINSATEKSSSE